MRRFTRNVFIVMVLVCAMAYIATAATVTQSINYQGKITDSSGNPLEGTYTVVFTIYDVPTGGTGLTGSIQSVRFTDGYFNTTLGLTNYYDGRALWLGIRVGSDTEMTPRQEIRPVPYALSLRPGAGIISTEWYPALDLRNSGGGMALNVSTSGSNSKGTVIKTTGTGGYGVDVNTTSSGSPGFYADTWGSGSQGFAANTHGADSPGVDVAAWGTGNSYGVMAYSDQSSAIYADTGRADQMYGLYCNDILFSRGIHLETATTGHEGARITTTGANSYGVNINTGNTNSPGVYALTNGGNSQGFAANTHGTGSHGVDVATTGSDSYGVKAQTYHSDTPGLYVKTYGEHSPGIQIETDAYQSEGIQARSAYGDTINATTLGDSTAIIGKAPSNWGIGVSATGGLYGLLADTPADTHMWGIYTDDYIYALGVQNPAYDVAEYMPVEEDVGPGTVMVIGDDGTLQESSVAYDTRVAGIVSTQPGVTLGTNVTGNIGEEQIAVAGRVPCKVDATKAPIHAGDLLTTSEIPGYAMRAADPKIGTVLGKAMGTLESGTGIIEVLVTLQ